MCVDSGQVVVSAMTSNNVSDDEAMVHMMEALEGIFLGDVLGDEGRALWKQEIGYHRRSRVETLMYRYKTVLGDRLSARRERTQATEVSIKLDALNRMTELGMPKSYKVIA